MAVFTALTKDVIAPLFSACNAGDVVDMQGIGHGMENSNYFIHCQSPGSMEATVYVLTVLEELNAAQAAFHVSLLNTLAKHRIPVPILLTDSQGNALHQLSNKPALISTRLSGEHINTPNLRQVSAVGNLMADLHMAACHITEDYQGTRDNKWLEQTVYQASTLLSRDEKAHVHDTLTQYLKLDLHQLPHGIIHGDLFRDNVFFEGDKLTGVIDFYSAGVGFLLFDLAVVINDWCRNENNTLDKEKTNVLLAAYCAKRPWTEQEQSCWPLMLQIAAMRFWLSRLLAGKGKSDDSLFIAKDPNEFKTLYLWHIANQQRI